MATTTIRNENGDLLWSPVSVAGAYSVQKTQEIADILAELLDNVQISSTITVDDDFLANVYTKSQSDQRYILVSNFNSLLNGSINNLINTGYIVGTNDFRTLTQRVLTLFNSCYGTNFEGEIISSNSYNSQLEALNNSYSALYNDVSRINRSIYYENPDGSLDRSKVLFAKVEDTGKTEELSSSFVGSNRSKLVFAINYTQSEINSTNNEITSIKNDITDVKSNITTVNNTIGDLQYLDEKVSSTSIVGSLNKISGLLTDINASISNLETRVSNLEGRL